MHIYFTFVIFLSGLVLASFFNALLYRIDNGYKYPEIFIKGSHCEKCNKYLTVYELIPVLSFLIFKGRCSKCGYRVPMYYPVSELILGISFGSIYFYSLPAIMYIVILFFFSFSYFDRIYKSVSALLVNSYLGILILYFFYMIFTLDSIPENSILLSLGVFLFIFLIGKLLKKPFGLGDILVLIGLSTIFTFPMYLGYIYLFLFISIIYALTLMIQKKATLKSPIPLIPLMYVSLGLFLLSGDTITNLIEGIYIF